MYFKPWLNFISVKRACRKHVECFPPCSWEVCVGGRTGVWGAVPCGLALCRWSWCGLLRACPWGSSKKQPCRSSGAGMWPRCRCGRLRRRGPPQVPSGQQWLQGWPGGQTLAATGVPVTSAKPLGLLRLLLVIRALGASVRPAVGWTLGRPHTCQEGPGPALSCVGPAGSLRGCLCRVPGRCSMSSASRAAPQNPGAHGATRGTALHRLRPSVLWPDVLSSLFS